MTSREDLDNLHHANDLIIRRAISALDAVWATLDKSDFEAVRKTMSDFIPKLVSSYGDLAAGAAAQWYAGLRAGDDDFTADLADPVSENDVLRDSHKALRSLGTSPIEDVQGNLAGAVQRQISYMARATVARNVKLDPKKPRFARVPRGARTCAFCTMLASRGWVYWSKEAAGITHRFHAGCDCQIVPEWKRGSIHFDGYDPDDLYEMYSRACDKLGTTDESEVLQLMRKQHPERLTDGSWPPLPKGQSPDGTLHLATYEKHRRRVMELKWERGLWDDDTKLVPPEVPAEPPEWRPDDIPVLRAKELNHIWYSNADGWQVIRGGHEAGYGWIADRSEFDQRLSREDILRAAAKALQTHRDEWENRTSGALHFDVRGFKVYVSWSFRKGRGRVTTISPDERGSR